MKQVSYVSWVSSVNIVIYDTGKAMLLAKVM